MSSSPSQDPTTPAPTPTAQDTHPSTVIHPRPAPPHPPYPIPGDPDFPHPMEFMPPYSIARPPPQFTQSDLFDLRQDILATLTTALAHASARVARAAAGQSVFSNTLDARLTFETLKQLKTILPHLPAKRPREDETRPPPWYWAGIIPICPLCLQGPGAHWFDRCPELPNHSLSPEAFRALKELQGSGRVRPQNHP